MTMVVLGVGVRAATTSPVPPPIVSVDLDAAGRWARANLPPACVDYIVDNAEQAYWLHLAVMGQPRSSPRTAEIDGYTANRAIGRWLEGKSAAVCRRPPPSPPRRNGGRSGGATLRSSMPSAPLSASIGAASPAH